MMTHDFAFLSTKIKSGLLASITLSHWIFISQINLTSSSSTTPSGKCSYHFSFLSRLCFSHNFQWNNFATVSCLLLYSRCASFLHSHIICCIYKGFTYYYCCYYYYHNYYCCYYYYYYYHYYYYHYYYYYYYYYYYCYYYYYYYFILRSTIVQTT